jgi:CheY-like chemotaxis protein
MVNVDDEYRRGLTHDIAVGEYLAIEVIDTGVGMEKHVLERIFEPFFTTKAPGKGTGLGLAAVYGCVKNHHGSIRVVSEPGKGSHFTILFPTVGVKQETDENAEQHKSEVIVYGKGHILLVDDEEDVRRLSTRALRTLGYKVTALTDGLEAVEFYKTNHKEVDLVILDMVMPKMDGRAAFREMKKINPGVKVLVVSGYAAETTARECMHEGALDFIAKPFWIGDLSQAVATYLG